MNSTQEKQKTAMINQTRNPPIEWSIE